MTQRDKIIADLYTSKEVADALAKMEPDYLREDLRQEMFAALCKKPDEDIVGMHQRGELRFYLVRIMLNMIRSDRSAFYKTYRRENERHLTSLLVISASGDLSHASSEDAAERQPSAMIEDAPLPGAADPEWVDRVEQHVNELHEYERGLLLLYAKMGNNCRPVAEATGISERGVRFAVERAKKNVKRKLKQV